MLPLNNHVYRIVVWQVLLGVVCIATFYLMEAMELINSVAATSPEDQIGEKRFITNYASALFALFSCVVPSAYYAWVQSRTFNATRLLAHGVMKMLLTGTLMALFVVVVGIAPVGFFVTFAIVQLAYFAN